MRFAACLPALLAAAALLVAALGASPGLTWDEPAYVVSGLAYVRDGNWALNHEHPPLAKVLYGLALSADGGGHGYLAPARGVAALLFAALVALTAWTGGRLFGATAGFLAGLALLLTPSVLAHAHLAALDLPMALAWMGAAALSLRGPGGWTGAWLGGLLWGLALLTKVNGVFLIGPLVLWGLASGSLRWKHLPVLVLVGLAVFLAGWPWLWQDTFSRLHGYILSQTVRWVVPTYYLGTVYNAAYPPWHYPLVMTAAALAPAVLVAALYGAWVLARKRPQGAGWLGLHALFTLGLACLPGVPRYDGIRLFLTAFPFLALLAGLGLDLGLRMLRRPALAVTAGVLVFVPTALKIRELSPCLLPYRSPLAGGLDLEATFWGDALTPDFLARVSAGRPRSVALAPLGQDYFRFLQLQGDLPASTAWARPEEADVLIVLGRRGMLTPEMARRFDSEPGFAEVRREGVCLAKALLPGRSLPATMPAPFP